MDKTWLNGAASGLPGYYGYCMLTFSIARTNVLQVIFKEQPFNAILKDQPVILLILRLAVDDSLEAAL